MDPKNVVIDSAAESFTGIKVMFQNRDKIWGTIGTGIYQVSQSIQFSRTGSRIEKNGEKEELLGKITEKYILIDKETVQHVLMQIQFEKQLGKTPILERVVIIGTNVNGNFQKLNEEKKEKIMLDESEFLEFLKINSVPVEIMDKEKKFVLDEF